MCNRSFLLKLAKPFLRPFKGLFKQLLSEGLQGIRGDIDKTLESKYDAYIRHLYYEVSDLRSLVRHLVAERQESLPRQSQTHRSFNHQWENLPAGGWMLSDPDFRATVTDRIAEFTRLDPSWFSGKRVLDAGCGSGRYTYGMAKLGAEVVAIDQSAEGIAEARNAIESEGLLDRITFHRHDILTSLPFDDQFDLVWSYGVLHHTGNTFGGFSNIVPAVKPGGYLFMMLYGEPRLGLPDEFGCYAEYGRLRDAAKNKTFEEIVEIIERERPGEDVHGWFDAVSPTINDCYQFSEIEGWLLGAGFTDIRRTDDSINHHIIARRKESEL